MNTRRIGKTMRFVQALWLLLGLLLVQSGPAAPAAQAADFMVDNLNPTGQGSLSQAIEDANANSGEDTITFSVSGVIQVDTTLPMITDPAGLTIDGWPQYVTIATDNGSLMIHVGSGAVADIKNLTIGGGTISPDSGIHNEGILTVTGVYFGALGGSSPTGAAVYNSSTGNLGIFDSYFWLNSSGSGGAIYNAGTAVVGSVHFEENVGDTYGGAIYNAGTLNVQGSTFSGNSAGSGGAIYNTGTLEVANSTFSGNSATGDGGAVYNQSAATVTHSTFSGNSAPSAGAFYNTGTLTLNNTLVAFNTLANCWGTIGDGGGNLNFPDYSCPGDNSDPLLDPDGLKANGGFTPTIALQPGSPAVDKGELANCLQIDQRDVSRPQGSGCDIGAYELEVLGVNIPPVANADSYATDEDTPLNVAAPGVLANDNDVNNDPLAAVLVSGTTNGALTWNGDGSFTYTPASNYNGSDSFTYKANDGTADSNIAAITITVNSMNDAPVANPDSMNVAKNGSGVVSTLANDSDVDGDTLTVVSNTQGAHGTVSYSLRNNNFRYKPAKGFKGTDTFTYTISDGHGGTATATVTVTVN